MQRKGQYFSVRPYWMKKCVLSLSFHCGAVTWAVERPRSSWTDREPLRQTSSNTVAVFWQCWVGRSVKKGLLNIYLSFSTRTETHAVWSAPQLHCSLTLLPLSGWADKQLPGVLQVPRVPLTALLQLAKLHSRAARAAAVCKCHTPVQRAGGPQGRTSGQMTWEF